MINAYVMGFAVDCWPFPVGGELSNELRRGILSAMTTKRVLIVEDEYFAADDLAEAFRASGAAVVGPVASLADALKVIGEGSPLDGAVVDINLRGEMSYPVADALAARHVPFLFLTGYAKQALPNRYGHIPHLEKPADVGDVIDALLH